MPDNEVTFAAFNAARPVLEQIANKWSVLILTVLCEQPARFNVLKRRLERNGLVHRRVITSSPVAVEYSITPLGRTLKDPFSALVTWAAKHGAKFEKAQLAYDRQNVGS
ncbi:MAG: Transcriptional regulator, HxlR family [uncultured Paraburkholderia sp.]|nr:MAG: Transcriptional regulator, HxlR family [uncultured Paraburkholderia sp.]CAH2925546.1 MAG: Transcriptional regulator, HxlR family [uncultured Paraburkholderia sp.]